MKKILLALALLAGISSGGGLAAGTRITLPTTGKQIFVSGMNLAWIKYANDVVSFDSGAMATDMKAVHDSGGNAMRIWLSTDGSKDPIFDANGYVSGPNSNTIANIQKMLRLAKQNNLVLILSLMSHNWMNTVNLSASEITRNKAMLQTDAGIAAYVTNYVIPVTKAIGADPNILCWEVFNEPEGMVQGWPDLATGITMANVQTVVNRVAGAIHRNVDSVLVSNGAVTMASTSSVGGTNSYTDANLIAAGSDTAGYLDFYMAHYYSSNGASPSPFTKTYAHWSLDKPLVIGEYPSQIFSADYSNFNATSVDSLLKYLDANGYAGGLGWMYSNNAGMAGYSSFSHSMKVEYRYDSGAVRLTGQTDNKFAVIASASGGTVVASATGRISSGTADTLKAIASTGYTFTGWSGDTAEAKMSGATLIIPHVAKDYIIQANFTPDAGTNLISNGDFSTGATGWTFYAKTGNTSSVDYSTGKAVITTTVADTVNYDIQVSQAPIELDSGVTYILTFDASSTGARPLAIGFSYGADPADKALNWKWLGGSDLAVSSTTTTFTVEVTPTVTAPTGVVQFNVGASTLPLTISNVSLVKVPTAIAPRSTPRSTVPSWSLTRSGANLVWSRSQALQAGGVVRLVGVNGQELSRIAVPAGARSGLLKAPSSGIAFLVLESADVREVQALPLAR
jgi:uncharacterized repeat protein (TIGR02543 family)